MRAVKTENRTRLIKSIKLVFLLLLGIMILLVRGNTNDSPRPRTTVVTGAVVPHDITAAELQNNLFRNITSETVTKVVLIGPNHFEAGGHHVISATTLNSGLSLDVQIIEKLEVLGLVEINDEVVNKDHSIGSVIDYVPAAFPNAKIIPLVISNYSSVDQVRSLSQRLADLLPSDAVVIASVDFSHYLSLELAEENDITTLALINAHDLEGLKALSSDYVDSPMSLAVVMEYSRLRGGTVMEVLDRGNSALISDNNYGSTTSYYTIIIYKRYE